MKKTIAIIATIAALCFAQEPSGKLAVYVYGASDAGINKSLGNKLLAALAQSNEYAEITDPGSLQDELAKSKQSSAITQIAQTAKRYGADFICIVSITEVFGTHSISARILKTSDFQIIKTGSSDHSLKSLDDLTAVSNELARQLLPVAVAQPPAADSAVAMPPAIDSVAVEQVALAEAQQQCDKTYNINELLFKIKEGFPNQLKDCSSKLAKDMLTPASLGGRKLVPISFMKQCAVDGIKNEIPAGFPDADKVVGSVDNFVQTLLNSASGAGGLDPRKLVSSIGSISTSINTLLNDVKSLSSNKCIVNEPYEPPAVQAGSHGEDEDSNSDDKSSLSFGMRIGFNFSHIYAEYNYARGGSYNSIAGMQLGVLLDIAASDVFHFQPGLMYVQRGVEDSHNSEITAHYIQIPVLLSLKFSALRLNAGPYLDVCLTAANTNVFSTNFGISTGFGFDLGWFYIGTFYDYGLTNMSNVHDSYFYNRTLGFNIGVNL